MAVIINELEIELEPQAATPKTGEGMPAPEKPSLTPLDLLMVLDREQRNYLRLMAH